MRILLFALLIACAAGPALAQPPESKSSLSVVLGRGQTWDDESSLGRGWLAGGAIDRALIGGLRAEASLEVLTHDRDEGFLRAEGRTVIGAASLAHRFGHGTAQPYIFAGVTLGHHSGSRTFVDVRADESSTDAGWRGGLGLAIGGGARYEITPELRVNRFFIENDSHPATMISLGIRLAVRL